MDLFSLLLKYNLPFTNKAQCVSDIQDWFCKSGSVWQKFAQTLSQCDEAIGKDLASALSKMYFDCPAHDDIYSARIIRDAFGDKYDTKTMIMIGSGTISQVYKVYDKSTDRFVAIKVMHPNVKREIRDAHEAYNRLRTYRLVPRHMINVLSLFFNGLREQLLMNREFKNGKLLKRSIHNTINQDNLFVIPEMIEYSKKCLVMSYEDSLLLVKIDIETFDKQVLYKACDSMTFLMMSMTVSGFLHADLHIGNVGIRNYESPDKMKVVIYDCGQCFDVSNIDYNARKIFAQSFLFKQPHALANIAFATQQYNEIVERFTTDNDDENITIICRYIVLNNDIIEKSVVDKFVAWSKLKTISAIFNILCKKYERDNTYKYLKDLGIDKYLDKYLPYPDFDCLRKL